jgi:hypothetical protein
VQELLEYTAGAAAVGGADEDARSECSNASSSGSSARQLAAADPAATAAAAIGIDDHCLPWDCLPSAAAAVAEEEGWKSGENLMQVCSPAAVPAAADGGGWGLDDGSVPSYWLVTPTASAGAGSTASCPPGLACCAAERSAADSVDESGAGSGTEAEVEMDTVSSVGHFEGVCAPAADKAATAARAAAAVHAAAAAASIAAATAALSAVLDGSGAAPPGEAKPVPAAADMLVGPWGSDPHITSSNSSGGGSGLALAPVPVEGCMSREASDTALQWQQQ